jgi:hypothetical protein
MKVSHNPYCSTRCLESGCSSDRPQLPNFQHLLRATGYSNMIWDHYSPRNSILGSDPTPPLDSQYRNRVEYGKTHFTRKRAHSPEEDRELSLAGILDDTSPRSNHLSSGDVQYFAKRRRLTTGSEFTISALQSSHGVKRAYKTGKASICWRDLHSSDKIATIFPLPQSDLKESATIHQQPQSVCHVRDTRGAESCLYQESKCSRFADMPQQYRNLVKYVWLPAEPIFRTVQDIDKCS